MYHNHNTMNQNRVELVSRLQGTADKLTQLFGDEYNVARSDPQLPNNNVEQAPRTTIVHNHVTNYNGYSYPWLFQPWYYPSNYDNYDRHTRQTIYKTDNDEKKKKKKKQDNPGNYLLGTIIIGTMSFVGTYVFAKDDYIKMLRYNINKDLDNILEASYRSRNFNDVEDIVKRCETWIKHYKRRTKPSFWSKIGLVGAGLAFGVGIFLGQDTVVLGSVATGVVSGCYLLWNYLINNSKYNKNIETLTFTNAMNGLDTSIYNIKNQSNVPSAPSLYDLGNK